VNLVEHDHRQTIMTTIGASPLMTLSPVNRPTEPDPYASLKSEYFWFDSALMGVV
jgi:hypothetical protein